MSIHELIESKKEHLERFSSKNGVSGERLLLDSEALWIKRPKGKEMANLLATLKQVEGIEIKPTSFDFILIPENVKVDFSDLISLANGIKCLTFIELKSCNQKRVTTPDFKGFFFAITENEMRAAQLLGDRHKVILHNKKTGDKLVTSVHEIISRASSMNWQMSVNLGADKI